MDGLTTQLGKFVANLTFEQLPAAVIPVVRTAFTDTVGVMMISVGEPGVEILRQRIMEQGSNKEARACLSSLYLSSPDAAFLGGTAAHAIDFDDQSLTGHPSSVLVPAILAEGERLGSNGRDLVVAYVAGYEIWAELIGRGRNYHAAGWHPTGVFGVIAAAAAAATLNRLSAERASAAMALAASHAGGLVANIGSMTKPYQAGRASRDGVAATRLAAAGMTTGSDTLENPQGFLTAYSPAQPDRESPARVGSAWYILHQGLCVKKYPCCYCLHRSFEAAVRLLADGQYGPADISQVEVTMGKGEVIVMNFHRPQTALQAKFSEEFSIAAAVVLGRMGPAEFTDSTVQRADIQAFFPKVKINAVEEYDKRDPLMSPTERVQIHLTNGKVLDSGPVEGLRGDVKNPFTVEELWAKFVDCTGRTHTEEEARQLFNILQAIDELPSVRDLPSSRRVFG